MTKKKFEYETAFSRNLGIFSKEEQHRLKNATVAIAGMGGVGGDYAISFARTGVGCFRLADFDKFEIANFNRQYGGTISNVGREKAAVMAEAVADINPKARIEVFSEGVTTENIDKFLDGANLIIDAIDLFAPDWHRKLITSAQDRDIPVLAAIPVGFGAGMVGFSRRSMPFDTYFDWNSGWPDERKVLQLALGFAPASFHASYISPTSVDLKAHRGPSSVAGCKACAAVIASQGVTAILNPNSFQGAPWFTHVDFKLMKFAHRRLLWGMRNPLMQVKTAFAVKKLIPD